MSCLQRCRPSLTRSSTALTAGTDRVPELPADRRGRCHGRVHRAIHCGRSAGALLLIRPVAMAHTIFVLLPFSVPALLPLPRLASFLPLCLSRAYSPRPLASCVCRGVRPALPLPVCGVLYHTLSTRAGHCAEIHPEWRRTAVWDLDSHRRLRSGRNAPFVPNRTNGDLLGLEGTTNPLSCVSIIAVMIIQDTCLCAALRFYRQMRQVATRRPFGSS